MGKVAGEVPTAAVRAADLASQARVPTERVPLVRSVRRWLWLPLVLAIGNGIFLYFFPWLAETLYAWSIKPPVNAGFMGAGYLTGVVASALALFVARYWRSVRPLVPPFGVLGLGLLGATLLHADRFFWGYPLTWAWTLIYFILPPGVVLVWVVQERIRAQVPAADPRLNPAKWLCLPLGAVLTIAGLIIYITPEAFIGSWPWQVTPLLLRCFASWYLLMGLTLVFVSVTTRRAHEVIVPGVAMSAFNIFLLLLPVLYAGSISFSSAGFWLWLLSHMTLLLVCVFTVFRGWRIEQADEGQVTV